ncbi:hypothetical protein B0T18DRAFT_95768 [Schizothecium vesticola]|uniref:Uncharacterized protein n=1 Tax=Schizothecium vesticola TaxID=314040 RepID=A0AA40K7N7_9PEZI|nr:hypothetical protein B0T18DRAFT_95768 [Schizothecium vesticola]
MQQCGLVQICPVPSDHHRLARPVAAPLDLRDPVRTAESHPVLSPGQGSTCEPQPRPDCQPNDPSPRTTPARETAAPSAAMGE